ncbi:selenium cofactor biosynthesis protein YqeC [Desulfofalx alkaliphila]|uniref:selenium cofactor biosynthesis protein YqeC n=1 Tax=Desulfofalx alkaliphila TaxID=105483 RepID=UPI0004E12298|nr:selenium cofactor biosynthesis protein YqeC [Desulfofalx alkaliphila]
MMKALKLTPKEMVCFVGGGGKTSLMLKLAEMCGKNNNVLVSTTTKMYSWQLEKAGKLVIESNYQLLRQRLANILKDSPIVAAGSRLVGDKVVGLDAKCLDEIYDEGLFDYILVEADGSRGKSLKLPAGNEPIIPERCTAVYVVTGADVLGKPLTADYVHRASLMAEFVGRPMGSIIDDSIFIKVINHYCDLKQIASKKVAILINKIDNEKIRRHTKGFAYGILSDKIKLVLLTSTLFPNPLREVLE